MQMGMQHTSWLQVCSTPMKPVSACSSDQVRPTHNSACEAAVNSRL
jgi:hypothetical protein